MDWNNISMLAEDDGGIIEVLFMVVVAVIGIFGSLASKAKQKKAEEARRQVIADKLRQQKAQEQEGEWEVVPPTPGQPKPRVVEAPPIQRQASASKPPVKKKTLQELMKPKKRSLLSEEVTQPNVGHEQVEHPQVVSAQLERKSKVGSKSVSRLARKSGQQAPAGKQVRQAQKPVVSLKNSRTLRQAMIYHEILAQPKALREDDNLWDSPY